MVGSTQLSAAVGFAWPSIQRNKATSGLGAASSALILAAVAVGSVIDGSDELGSVVSATGEVISVVWLVESLVVVVVVMVVELLFVVVIDGTDAGKVFSHSFAKNARTSLDKC